MNCIACDHTYTKVLDTRIFETRPEWTKRRRRCPECGHVFFTLELPVDDLVLEEPAAAPDESD